jgi:hypothetical protein
LNDIKVQLRDGIADPTEDDTQMSCTQHPAVLRKSVRRIDGGVGCAKQRYRLRYDYPGF